MTKQEAVKYLIMPSCTSTNPSETYLKQLEAYNMAVEALLDEKPARAAPATFPYSHSCERCLLPRTCSGCPHYEIERERREE